MSLPLGCGAWLLSLLAGVVLVAVGADAHVAVPVVTTVAGGGLVGPALSFGQDPQGVAVLDRPGGPLVYVPDEANHVVRVLDVSAGTQRLVAGGGVSGFGGDGGPATSAKLKLPRAVAVDRAGNLFIVDLDASSSGGRVRRVDAASGVITTVAGTGTYGFGGDGGPATEAQFADPSGVAVDLGGNLFIADTSNGRLRRVEAVSGVITTVAGTGPPGFSGDGGPASSAQVAPHGVAVDASGNLFLADAYNVIRRVDAATGIITTVAGTGGTFGFSGDGGPATSARLNSARSVAVDGSGNLFIADVGNNRVRRVDAATGVISTVGGTGVPGNGFGGDGGPATAAQLTAYGVGVDRAGSLFIADYLRVRRVDGGSQVISTVAGNGTLSGSFGGDGGPAVSAVLGGPRDMAVDGAGNVVIADTENSRVRRVDAATGVVTTLAGAGAAGFGGDGGPAGSGLLNGPGGVAVDSVGNVFIADSGNHRVRRVDAATGVISTVAGTGTAGFVGDGGLASLAQLNGPQGVVVDGAGNVFIADTVNGRVRRVDAANQLIITVAGSGLSPLGVGGSDDGGPAVAASLLQPYGVDVDSAGNLFIADSGNQRVRRVDVASRVISTVAGVGAAGFGGDGGPAGSAKLSGPRDVEVDGAGNVFIADTGNQRVRRVDAATGLIATIAGSAIAGPGGGFVGDLGGDGGPATAGLLNEPGGVAVDGSGGRVLVADTGNDRVRLVAVPVPPVRVAADFNGDGRSDIAVYRPSDQTWYVQGGLTTQWGAPNDVAVPADYNGDGTTDVAVFRPSDQTWYVRGGLSTQWGIPGDVPVPADYDGDGKADIAVFRPSDQAWYVKGGLATQWGVPGDVPVPGDYGGDGHAHMAVFRPSDQTWYVQGGLATQWGVPGDVPVPGDYNGDRKTDVAVYRPSDRSWYSRGTGGVATQWGALDDVAVPADYNGDGTTDIAVYRRTDATWYVQGGLSTQLGAPGDIPVAVPAALRAIQGL